MRWFSTLLLLCILPACSALYLRPVVESTATGLSFNNTKMRNAVNNFLEAANVLDGNGVAACWAENGVFIDGYGTTPIVGRKNITEFWTQGFQQKWLLALNFVPATLALSAAGVADMSGTLTMTVVGKKRCWVHLQESFIIRFDASYSFIEVNAVYDDPSEQAQIKACLGKDA
eukprot:NODE_8413_length_703_cov_69.948276_g8157_i0.p1 GENE.NODE_8413_length_703_cov_69.948276_g8157_i0~~NODE_8413_length_703_cov_69.948276_g8157_i0.p1  ORF type:complete len:189 (-),score=37.70 NODE_8413_length_703_cov_69.948276_g8157_i0:137-655(-)